MGLRSRILKVVAPESGGPRKQTVLRGLARGKENFDQVFDEMRRRGELVLYSSKRGALWGLPRKKTA